MASFDRSSATDNPERNKQGDTVELRETLGKFWARKRLILASTVLGVGLAFAAAKLITPVYSGSVYVMVDLQQPGRPAGGPGMAGYVMPAGPDAMQTQAQTQTFVLQSRALAEATVRRLELDRDPEFNPLLRQPGLFSALSRPVSALLGELEDWLSKGLSGSTDLPSGGENTATAENAAPAVGTEPSAVVVDAFMKRLHASAQEHSQIIQVTFSSSRATMAALVPNTLVQLYLENQVDNKKRSQAQEIAWLDKMVSELRQKMLTAAFALAEYRQKSGLVSEKDPTLVAQELSQIRSQLAIVEARKAEAATRLSRLQGLLSPSQDHSASAGGTASNAVALESPVLERLREREAGLIERLAANRGLLGDDNPETLRLEAQLSAVKVGIRSEAARAATRLRADLAAAAATEATLERQENEFTHEFAQASGGDPQLTSLIDAADADRKTFEGYLARSNDAHSEVGRLQPDARIVSAAAVPLKPSFPPTRTMLMAGLALGTGMGIVLAAMTDALLGGLRSQQQAEDALGIRCLGLVPKFKRWRRNRPLAAQLRGTIQDPSSARPGAAAFGRAIYGVQTKLITVGRDSGSQVILVTAALPKEGKSRVAVSLAVSLAAEGFPVALVDCDLHRPIVHRMFNGPSNPGLTDYFAGRARFDQVVHSDYASGVDYVPIGSDPSRESRYITLDRLRRLVARVRETHPFIILDSAPLLAAPETAMLSQIAQKTILVVRWGRTPAQIARHAVTQLLDSSTSEAAAVLSRVDFKRAAKYGDLVAGAYWRLGYYVDSPRGRTPLLPPH